MKTRIMNGETQHETQPGTWATREKDGAINVHDADGRWLGWVKSNGEPQSMCSPDRASEPRVVAAAAELRANLWIAIAKVGEKWGPAFGTELASTYTMAQEAQDAVNLETPGGAPPIVAHADEWCVVPLVVWTNANAGEREA